MNPASHLRAIAAHARNEAGTHGVAHITVWQAERAADELERLTRRVAELEATATQPALFGDTP